MGFLREYCESWEEDTRWKRGDDLPVRVRRGCVHYLSTDLSVCYLADTINAMDGALFAQYMRYTSSSASGLTWRTAGLSVTSSMSPGRGRNVKRRCAMHRLFANVGYGISSSRTRS